MKLKVLRILLIALFCVIPTVAQDAKENLLDKVDLTFFVKGNPTVEDAGFNNPKSFWRIEYELYLFDWDALKKSEDAASSRKTIRKNTVPIRSIKSLIRELKKSPF